MLDYMVQRDCNLTQIGGNFCQSRFAFIFYLTKFVSTSRLLFALTSTRSPRHEGFVFSSNVLCIHIVNLPSLLIHFIVIERAQAMALRLQKEAFGVTKSRWQSSSFRRREKFRFSMTSGGKTQKRLVHATRSKGSQKQTPLAWETSEAFLLFSFAASHLQHSSRL